MADIWTSDLKSITAAHRRCHRQYLYAVNYQRINSPSNHYSKSTTSLYLKLIHFHMKLRVNIYFVAPVSISLCWFLVALLRHFQQKLYIYITCLFTMWAEKVTSERHKTTNGSRYTLNVNGRTLHSELTNSVQVQQRTGTAYRYLAIWTLDNTWPRKLYR